MPDIGKISDRDTVHLEQRVLVLDLLVLEILDSGSGANLPQRRIRRVLLAEIAGRINHFGEFVDLALGAPRAVGDQAAVLGEQRAHAAQHAVAHAGAQFGIIGEQHLAVRLQHHDVAGGRRDVGVAVVDDAVGTHDTVVLPRLDVTGRDTSPRSWSYSIASADERDRLVGIDRAAGAPAEQALGLGARRCRNGGKQKRRRAGDGMRPPAPTTATGAA